MNRIELKDSWFMSEIWWILFSSCLMCLLTSKTKREEKFYRKKEVQNIVKKYTIIAEIIGSLFIIVLCSLLPLALYQSGGYIINAIFLISLYILTLMVCTFVIVYILGKVNRHWDPDEIYLTIAPVETYLWDAWSNYNFFFWECLVPAFYIRVFVG